MSSMCSRASKVLLITGLLFALGGAVYGLKAVWISDHEAVQIGVMRLSGDTEAENLKLPAVQNLLLQSSLGVWAFSLIAVGTVLQIAGVALSKG